MIKNVVLSTPKYFISLAIPFAFLFSPLSATMNEDEARSPLNTRVSSIDVNKNENEEVKQNRSSRLAFFRGKYKATSGDIKEFFILPSNHLYPYKLLPENIKDKINTCKNLACEVDYGVSPIKELSSVLSIDSNTLINMNILRGQDEEPWWEKLEPEHQKELSISIDQGYPMYPLRDFSLPAIYFVYSCIKDEQQFDEVRLEKGMSHSDTLDVAIYENFKKAHKSVFALETQLDRFNTFKPDVNLEDLKQTITFSLEQRRAKLLLETDNIKKYSDDWLLVEQYKNIKSNYEASTKINTFSFEKGLLNPITDRFVALRNELWFSKIPSLIEKEGVDLFVFGSGHCITYDSGVNKGILKFFLDAGCKLERELDGKWYPINEYNYFADEKFSVYSAQTKQ